MPDYKTDVWFRNPDNYIRELVETGEKRIAWDRGRLVKVKIDPNTFGDLYFGAGATWEALVIGEQGAAHIDQSHTMKAPRAVYPVWEYGDDFGELEELMAENIGQDKDACSDMSVPPDERPVFGQRHMVVISGLPPSNTGPGRRVIAQIKELHEDYYDTLIHIHNMYSFRVLFGLEFGSADFDPRTDAKGGNVIIPPGKKLSPSALVANPQWARMLGFNPVDLDIPRNRCIFNIKSAVWAAENWHTQIAPKTRGVHEPDTTTPAAAYFPPTVGTHVISARVGLPTDKVICDECSLAVDCSYYRSGAVCSIPKTDTASIARHFGTRDADTILDGLQAIVERNAKRLDKSLHDEEVMGDINPDTTKMTGLVFDQGMKLAKLLDPRLRGGPSVQVNVGSGGQAEISVGADGPRKLVASAIRELEAQGFKREDITPEMVDGIIRRLLPAEPRAIPGEVVRGD